MARIERVRDALDAPPEEFYWEERVSAGWRLAAIEWQRDASGEEAGASEGESPYAEESPYGLRVGEDCHHLVEDPEEMRALTLMLDGIVADRPMSQVAESLNEKGLSMRDGGPWTRSAVFQMLPRLIEVGPRIFSSEDWRRRKRRLLRAV